MIRKTSQERFAAAKTAQEKRKIFVEALDAWWHYTTRIEFGTGGVVTKRKFIADYLGIDINLIRNLKGGDEYPERCKYALSKKKIEIPLKKLSR